MSREVLGLGWPGLRYGLPTLVAAGTLLALTWLCLRLIAERPRVADTAVDVDGVMRRAAARRILSAALGAITFSGGWFALTAGSRIAEAGTGVVVPIGVAVVALGCLWAAAGVIVAVTGVLWPVRTPMAHPAAGRTSP